VATLKLVIDLTLSSMRWRTLTANLENNLQLGKIVVTV
jgi:hypothetical protein